jgi:hypothetical protein
MNSLSADNARMAFSSVCRLIRQIFRISPIQETLKPIGVVSPHLLLDKERVVGMLGWTRTERAFKKFSNPAPKIRKILSQTCLLYIESLLGTVPKKVLGCSGT